MPRSTVPANLKKLLPKGAQTIWLKSYNSAYNQYADKSKRRGDESRAEAAHRVAWAAVKKKYEKGRDDKWHVKK